MTEAYDWSWLRSGFTAPPMTMHQYLDLDEDISRRIEVVDGLAVFCESAGENHTGLQQGLVAALQEAIFKHAELSDRCYKVRQELDLLLTEVPTFTFRRPDVMVYRCLPEDRGGRWRTPRADDVEIVIEIVSRGSTQTDLFGKRAQYAAARVPRYWIVRMAEDDGPAITIERFRLTTDGVYVSEDISQRARSPHAVDTIDPFPITITWDSLDANL